MRTYVRYARPVTAQGSPYSRFERAVRSENLDVVMTALAELPNVALDDALEVLTLMARKEDPRYDRFAARFCARMTVEQRLDVETSRRVLALVEVLPLAPEPVGQHLRLYCRRPLAPASPASGA